MVVQHALRALRLSARSLGADLCGGSGARPQTRGTGAGPPTRPTGAGPPSRSTGAGPPAACGASTAVPPCAPCLPHPPPPCRARHPTSVEGIRVVCCPQRPKKPPPCPPANCTLTCSNMTRQTTDSMRSEASPLIAGGQDCVAWRLQRAERLRREDYEDEVATRASEPPPPGGVPPAPYALGTERELARATDGRLYAISSPRSHCSTVGKAPPPRLVTLEESNPTCHIGDEYIDPCAYQPRVFLEIDRSVTEIPSAPASLAKRCAATCPRQSQAPRAGGTGWCKNPPSYPGAPQRCRPLTIVERLRARTSRLAPRGPGKGARHLHTSAAASGPADGLQELLRSREHLKEAGRGRVVVGKCMSRPSRTECPGGKLDMRVPAGTTGVRVRVYLDGADYGSGGATWTAAGVPEPRHTTDQKLHVPCQTQDLKKKTSWLSMKTFKNKLPDCPDSKTTCTAAQSPGSKPKCRCTSSIILLTNTVVAGSYF